MGNNTQNTDIHQEVPKVDDAAVRRKSILSGMWNGMKKGLMWGGIGGLATTGIFTALGLKLGAASAGLATSAAASTPAFILGIAKIPVVGPPAAAILAVGASIIGYNAATAATAAVADPAGIMLGMLSAFSVAAVPIMGVTLGAGALIGGLFGAISGYREADSKVALAHRQADAQAAQLAFERQQVQRAILQQQEIEMRRAQQTQDLYASFQNQPLGGFTPNAPYAKQGHDQGKDPKRYG